MKRVFAKPVGGVKGCEESDVDLEQVLKATVAPKPTGGSSGGAVPSTAVGAWLAGSSTDAPATLGGAVVVPTPSASSKDWTLKVDTPHGSITYYRADGRFEAVCSRHADERGRLPQTAEATTCFIMTPARAARGRPFGPYGRMYEMRL